MTVFTEIADRKIIKNCHFVKVSLLLTSNKITSCSSVSIVNIEHVFAGNLKISSTSFNSVTNTLAYITLIGKI